MIRVESSVVINRPAQEVFEKGPASPERWSQWNSTMVSMAKASDGPMDVGAQLAGTMKFLGRTDERTFEVVDYTPHRSFAFKSTSGPFAMKTSVHLEPLPEGTKVTEIVEGEPEGAFLLAEPLVTKVLKRQRANDLQTLKDLLEAGV